MALIFKQDSNFRIAQVTDIHLKEYPLTKNDQEILVDIEKGLRALNPDLIVITGDLLNSFQNQHERQLLELFFHFLNRFDVPKAITYGNHDAEYKMSRQDYDDLFEEIVELTVVRKHEKILGGLTQYCIEIFNQEKELERVLYVMDSGKVSPSPNRTNDWILPEQVLWFREASQKYIDMRNNLFFLHIPLPEYIYARENILNGQIGEPNRLISASRINTGLFSELFFSKQIFGVFCGHNHLNNAELIWENIHLIYGLFSGKEDKAKDFRGIRYIDLIEENHEVITNCLFYEK